MDDAVLPAELRDELRAAWHRYVDLTAPLRADLHRYCRRLTGNVWDAEDLVQETLLRGFSRLGQVHHEVRNPRAYLLRAATHGWIDSLRRRAVESEAQEEMPAPAPPGGVAPGLLRDAGSALLGRLAPQERAAVLLKDLFDFRLEEISELLGTSVGAVKSALHRGRERLREPEFEAHAARHTPSAALVDRFVALYAAKDVAGLVALMQDGGSIENVGCGLEFGREAFESSTGWFHAAVFGHPEWPAPFKYEAARIERAVVDGEPLVLGFTTRGGREALEQVLRFEEVDGRILRMRGYAFCPETMREIAAALDLPVRTGLYRYPTPSPGKIYRDP
ncbi:MAG TPA: sigma-70 family RNA polymerase sigma factor [Myxococcota bacterium]|nr:sigma-70 family RNA polymerase sigma factor [Myxococcota bacterium]